MLGTLPTLTRGELLRAGGALALALPAPTWGDAAITPVAEELALADAAALILASCPQNFLRAVATSNACLYRGEDLQRPALLAPPPDLLDETTYGSTGVDAVAYFACLESSLAARRVRARPSNGHIGTSQRADAEVWGSACRKW